MLVPICYIWVNQTVLEYRLYIACLLFTVLSIAWRVTFVQVWFDMDYKLMRLDYRPSSGAPPYYSNDPITEIHDYTIGGLCNPSKPFPVKKQQTVVFKGNLQTSIFLSMDHFNECFPPSNPYFLI